MPTFSGPQLAEGVTVREIVDKGQTGPVGFGVTGPDCG
jgi:hypothetical protein